MISPRAAIPLNAGAAGTSPAAFSPNWKNIGHVAELAVWDAANRAKDRQDEAIDAMRVSGGMTLDQFLDQK